MDKELLKKIEKISDIYSSIYIWLLAQSSGFENRIVREKECFMSESCDSKLIDEKISNAYSKARERAIYFDAAYERLAECETGDCYLDLRLYTDLMEYLYYDVQREVFIYNVIYNKVWYYDKFVLLCDSIGVKTTQETLDLLAYIDQNTTVKYLDNARRTVETHYDQPEVIQYIQLMSTQKKWEKTFSDFMMIDFSELLIKVRNKIHDKLAELEQEPDESEKYACWLLLPHVERVWKAR